MSEPITEELLDEFEGVPFEVGERLVAIARAALTLLTSSKQAARLRSRWAHTNDDTLLGHIELLDRTITASRSELERLVLGG